VDVMRFLELKIPPLALLFFLVAGQYALADWVPFADLVLHGKLAITGFVCLVGGLIALLGVYEFRKFGTTVNPTNPDGTVAIVNTGVYGLTRNPMYVGFAFMLLSAVIFSANYVSLISLPMYVLYMNRFQIQPEEKMLFEKFGAPYTAYLQAVRRWL
jgi:protein-S-isoprenylcysteine O-methyltransferase Ste14